MTKSERRVFVAGAAFRVQGFGLDFDSITREIGYSPTHTHRQGELGPIKELRPRDMWLLDSPLIKDQPLEAHLNWLVEIFLPRKEYVLYLKERFIVDIYCYKTCYTEQASLTLSTQALRIFVEFDLPMEISLLFLPEDTKTEAGQ